MSKCRQFPCEHAYKCETCQEAMREILGGILGVCATKQGDVIGFSAFDAKEAMNGIRRLKDCHLQMIGGLSEQRRFQIIADAMKDCEYQPKPTRAKPGD